MADADLYLRKPDDPSDEVLIAGPLLGALRTVLEVERLADAVEQLPDDKPALALLDGTLAFWDLQRGNYPRYVAERLVGQRFQTALARLRAASTDRRPVAVAAYTSRPRTTEGAGAVRLMLCGQNDDDCNRLCSARRSELAPCDRAAGFDDRELFELVLAPGHRSPLYRSIRLAARFALGLATGQEWSHFYYLNGGAEIARVEAPDWLASDPEPLALSHAMLVKQCQLGMGYPVVVSEAHDQAVISGHDRAEFRRMPLMLLEQRGRPAPESARATSKRRPWVRTHLPVRPVTRAVARFQPRRSVGPAAVMPEAADSNASKIANKKSQAPMEGRRLAHARHQLGLPVVENPNAGWRPGRQLCLFSGRL